jgi:hypothetical protein
MQEKLRDIRNRAEALIAKAAGLKDLNEVRIAYLGKKGELTAVLKGMKNVDPSERPRVGQMVNEAREIIESALQARKAAMEHEELMSRLDEEEIDVTLPSNRRSFGHSHPNTIALEEVEQIFIGMGYEVVEGPEIEYDYYNFEALNIPENHPAKDEQDTFYINDNILLRTQTSSVQIHMLEDGRLPIRMIAPAPREKTGSPEIMWNTVVDTIAREDRSFVSFVGRHSRGTLFESGELVVTVRPNKIKHAEDKLVEITRIARGLYGQEVFVTLKAGDPEAAGGKAEAVSEQETAKIIDDDAIVSDIAADVESLFGMKPEITG